MIFICVDEVARIGSGIFELLTAIAGCLDTPPGCTFFSSMITSLDSKLFLESQARSGRPGSTIDYQKYSLKNV